MRTLLLVPALALALAACGGGTPTSAGGGSTAGQPPAAAAFAYARCMRQHGASNFPDPKVHVSGDSTSVAMVVPGTLASSPNFKTAEKACSGMLPAPANRSPAQQHARALHLLAFARCMRAHSVRSFPDPTPDGQITREMLAAPHINVQVASVQKAAYACVSAAGGAVTAAQIHQAIARDG